MKVVDLVDPGTAVFRAKNVPFTSLDLQVPVRVSLVRWWEGLLVVGSLDAFLSGMLNSLVPGIFIFRCARLRLFRYIKEILKFY